MSEIVIPYEDLKRANDLLQRQVCDFANTRPALIAERDAALRQVEAALEIADLYFAPWGAAKGARWEALTGDKPFLPDVALDLIRTALGSTTAAATPRPVRGDGSRDHDLGERGGAA